MKVEDRVFLVTGGGSGLGEATARLAARRGGRVAILDLPSSNGAAVAAEIGEAAAFFAADVVDHGQVEAAVGAAARQWGRLDFCVNCAGIVVLQKTIDDDGRPGDVAEFDRAVATNLTGTFAVASQAAAHIAGHDPDEDGLRGVIVNTSSIAGVGGQTGSIGYAASKSAVAGMTLPMARDLAPWGIRVVAIAPGPMQTAMLGESSTVTTGVLANVLLPRRAGRPEEFADLVLFLIENDLINAEVVRQDMGGRLSRGGSANDWEPR